MIHWEYQVIRINIEPPADTQIANTIQPDNRSDGGSQGQPSINKDAFFSKRYLKEEFPSFYDRTNQSQQQEQANNANDPAFQLQTFLNTQGLEGWEAIGLQHAGPHTFVVLKRPKQEGEKQADQEQLKATLELASKCIDLINKQSIQ